MSTERTDAVRVLAQSGVFSGSRPAKPTIIVYHRNGLVVAALTNLTEPVEVLVAVHSASPLDAHMTLPGWGACGVLEVPVTVDASRVEVVRRLAGVEVAP